MANTDLIVKQGKTFVGVFRYGLKPYVYKPITGIAKIAPVRITAVAHGIVDQWPVAVVSAGGMREINAQHMPPRTAEFFPATVIGVDTVDFNDINAASFTAYTSGGYLQYLTPVSLAGSVARLTVKDRVGGTVILALTSSPAAGIVLDDTLKTITYTISATQSAALSTAGGLFELELQDGSGVVTQLRYGNFVVDPPEIAT